jgi:hypothetical protein
MRSLFNIHAGEYLVGSKLETHERKPNVWIPSKDVGVDLLVSCKNTKNFTSIQVKFSKDYNFPHGSQDDDSKDGFVAGGWWQFKSDKIVKSTADYWVLVLYSANRKIGTHFIVLKPAVLLSRLQSLRGHDKKTLNTYLEIHGKDKCFETRQLRKSGRQRLDKIDIKRDFTEFLDQKLNTIFEDWD